ncbi:hypothetical protein SCLCIDRAFT_1212660 [Scleroderma citrinum Foug A]|uniref:Uncharacterized protein n=1 Tax=Scleroderma citrinum Foug A TaxID=1036808 RepID=A0A0C3EAI3_9AGAM|nr:hypothetical protein SCLCIDRAFT_1212660 [Scleroderma citrinum Foug A]
MSHFRVSAILHWGLTTPTLSTQFSLQYPISTLLLSAYHQSSLLPPSSVPLQDHSMLSLGYFTGLRS